MALLCFSRLALESIGIENLVVSPRKPKGFVATPSPSLLEKVRDHGVIEPIVVRPLADGKYEILANPETAVAAGRLGLKSVPAIVRDDVDDDDATEIVRAHYGAHRRNPIDEALDFADRLEQLGGRSKHGAITRLSVLTGRNRPYIAHALRLLTLPAAIQDMVRNGVLSAGQARPLVSVNDRAEQLALAKKIASKKLSARQAEKLARSARSGVADPAENTQNEPADRAGKDPDIARLERLVSRTIGTEFIIEDDRAVIKYFGNLEILEGVLSKLGVRL